MRIEEPLFYQVIFYWRSDQGATIPPLEFPKSLDAGQGIVELKIIPCKLMKPITPLELDVRPLLARGEEPFPAIIEQKAKLQEGQSLLLIAPFEPTPLYPLFRAEGFTVESTPLKNGDWQIQFHSTANTVHSKGRELDLRELEPPEPLQRALETLPLLGREETLTIHTRFRPVHLLEQLDGPGFEGESEEVGKNHWTTHIWRLPPD